MNYLIQSQIGKFNYYLKSNNSYAIPFRSYSFEGLRNNGTPLIDKYKAEEIRYNLQKGCQWPLEVIPIKPNTHK